MNSSTLAIIHFCLVTIFVAIYLIKTILLFSNVNTLRKFSKAIMVPEMIVSTLFLATGVWLIILVGAIKVLQIIKLILVFTSIPLAIIGFRRESKALAFLSFLMIAGAFGLAEAAIGKPYIKKKVIVQGNASDAFNMGGVAYAANCSMCHGLDGKKHYRGASDLTESTMDIEAAAKMISTGKNRMPAFKNVLTSSEIEAIAQYIQPLQSIESPKK